MEKADLTLDKFLDKHRDGVLMNLTEFFPIFSDSIIGLTLLHSRGIAHRDIKPENIMLDEHANVKFMDFGFAGPLEGRDGTGYLTTYLGTEAYMAPEILLQEPY